MEGKDRTATAQSQSEHGVVSVEIQFEDMQMLEDIPHRVITLSSPSYELKIGRGSQSEQFLRPQEYNAWFTARVMSRDHAVLRAEPLTQKITLEDTGSMHGTYVAGNRLTKGERVPVEDGSVIRFGTEIVRGELTYVPLQLKLKYTWSDRPFQAPMNARPYDSLTTKNSFTVDYQSEDGDVYEEDEDDDIELVYESTRALHSESDRQSRTFSVPDSDASEISDKENDMPNGSAPSSPVEAVEPTVEKSTSSLPVVVDGEYRKKSFVKFVSQIPGSTIQSALHVDDDDDEEDGNYLNDDVDPEDFSVSDEDSYIDQLSPGSDESDEDIERNPAEELEQMSEKSRNLKSDDLKSCATKEDGDRAPSPSDAAMPKPSPLAPTYVPNIQSLLDATTPQSLTYPDTFVTEPSSFAPQQTFNYYPGVGWCGNSFLDTYEPGFAPNRFSDPATWRNPYHDSRLPQEPSKPEEVLPTPATSFDAPKTSKVSINDIIDEVRPDLDLHGDAVPNSRKRKANEISTSTYEDDVHHTKDVESPVKDSAAAINEESTGPATSTVRDDITKPVQNMNSKATVDASPKTHKKSVSFSSEPIVIGQEPPRKKAKVEHPKQGNSFVKYAATAIAGAAIGAVGTVFGLAALPAEYFA